MNVLVVGGAESLIQGAFGQKLASHGIEVAWHEVRPARLEILPDAAEGVLIIKDMVSHALSGAAISLAKLKGIPFAQVTRKFSHAYPVLRDSGFLTAAATINAAKGQPANTPVFVAQPTTQPITFQPQVADQPKETDMTPISTATTKEDLTEAMDLIFREDPYTIKSAKLVKQRLFDLTQYLPSDAEVADLTMQKKVVLWNMTGKLSDPAKREFRALIRQRWMVSYMKEVYGKTKKPPTFAELNAEARKHFGATLEAKVIRQHFVAFYKELNLPPFNTTLAPIEADTVDTMPVEAPAVEQQSTADMWDALTAQIDKLTQQVSSLTDHFAALHTHSAARINELEARLEASQSVPAAPVVVAPVAPAAPASIVQMLAELANSGLVLKIETK